MSRPSTLKPIMNKIIPLAVIPVMLIIPLTNGHTQEPVPAATASPNPLLEKIQGMAGLSSQGGRMASLSEAEITDIMQSIKNPFISQLPRPVTDIRTVETAGGPQDVPIPPPESVPEVAPAQKEVVVPKPEFQINGLTWDTPQPQAIVNSLVVDVGDYVGQWKITGIDKEGIKVKYQTFEYLIEPKRSSP